MNDSGILTLITFAPAIGAVVLMLLPRNDRTLRWTALIFSLLTFGFSLYLPFNFDHAKTGFQFDINTNWIGQTIH